jgi:hypothetical protein
MLLDHLDGILNYCRTQVRFGVVEAINGKIKTLLRRGVAGELLFRPSCYDSAMSNLVIVFIHFIATLARQVPGITSVSSRSGFRKCLALSSVD